MKTRASAVSPSSISSQSYDLSSEDNPLTVCCGKALPPVLRRQKESKFLYNALISFVQGAQDAKGHCNVDEWLKVSIDGYSTGLLLLVNTSRLATNLEELSYLRTIPHLLEHINLLKLEIATIDDSINTFKQLCLSYEQGTLNQLSLYESIYKKKVLVLTSTIKSTTNTVISLRAELAHCEADYSKLVSRQQVLLKDIKVFGMENGMSYKKSIWLCNKDCAIRNWLLSCKVLEDFQIPKLPQSTKTSSEMTIPYTFNGESSSSSSSLCITEQTLYPHKFFKYSAGVA